MGASTKFGDGNVIKDVPHANSVILPDESLNIKPNNSDRNVQGIHCYKALLLRFIYHFYLL